MKLFINGGGEGEQTASGIKKFNEVIDHNKPLLYIPLAMKPEKYDKCYEWIKGELSLVDVPNIDMVRSIEELEEKDFNDYSAIFIGGGNTYKLLYLLKNSKCFDKLKEYALNDGVIYGGSAGAIIFGYDINSCSYMDDNNVGLEDTHGFDFLNNLCIAAHYTSGNEEDTKTATDYLKSDSLKHKIIALPEDITLYYDNGTINVLGNNKFYLFEVGNIITFNDKSNNRIEEYNALKTADELMNFMDNNITYGWNDLNNKIHINNLFRVRQDYRVSSLEQTLNSGVGTCVEQANIIKTFFDRTHLENKLYCYRGYETEDNFDQEVRMHCFVLFKDNDKWYHFEHSNRKKRGIHPYNSIEEAIDKVTEGYEENGDIRVLTEIPSIPDGITFKEFNEYVNSFDEVYKKKK